MHRRVIIVGGGITGLTAAYELARQGRPVTVLEKEDRVGGLARSFAYAGSTFDIGPHRFYAPNRAVRDFIAEVLADQAVTIPRRSGVHFIGKYYTWPLKPAALFTLPPSITIRAAADLLALGRGRRSGPDNFEDYMVRHFGPTLYRAFFKDYTEKFLGLAPARTHPQWAKTGMKQAVINEDIVHRSLLDIIRYTFTPIPQAPARFIYPASGIGLFCARLGEMLRRKGGEIRTADTVAAVKVRNGRVEEVRTRRGGACAAEALVWTAPISELCALLGLGEPGLDYRSLVLYNLELAEPPLQRYQWCYFGSRDISFSRVTTPALFSHANCPAGAGSLCVELGCQEG
ncbi:MAG: FAD-dependent oxidoreductase, partial [Elusimicrobia bacterium]|nr:FAD-dependent oxidoreductase [Elusimicrobiota bacterium]